MVNVLGEIALNLPGLHNIYNSLASIAVGVELEIPFDVIKHALENLQGVQRRMEMKGEIHGVMVIDDYGHHPTEIKSTLKALGDCWPERRKVVVFQPHRYSRTLALFDEFATAFYQSDLLLVLPIYAAGEDEIEGVDAEKLCEAIQDHGHKEVVYVKDQASAVKYLEEVLSEKDVLLTLGAGDVWKVGEAVLEKK